MFNMKKVTFTIVNIYLISHVMRASVGLQLSQPLWRNIDALWRPFFSGSRGWGTELLTLLNGREKQTLTPMTHFNMEGGGGVIVVVDPA